MGIIWLIEDPNLETTLSSDLCANFPVRTVASFDSLGKLISIEGQFLPNIIVCRCPKEMAAVNALNLIRCHSEVPIVLISENDDYKISIDEKYLIFPLKLEISSLFSVIRRLVRRESSEQVGFSAAYTYKHLSLDKTSQYAETDCGRLKEKLPSKEAGILQILIEQSGECVPRDVLVARLWQNIKVGPRTVDSHVSRLRKRLDKVGIQIENVYGSGYILK